MKNKDLTDPMQMYARVSPAEFNRISSQEDGFKVAAGVSSARNKKFQGLCGTLGVKFSRLGDAAVPMTVAYSCCTSDGWGPRAGPPRLVLKLGQVGREGFNE